MSRQLALAPQPQPFFGFELRHSKQMAEHLEPVAIGEFCQFGHGLRDEGHGLVGAALLACLIRLRSTPPTRSCALPAAPCLAQKSCTQ